VARLASGDTKASLRTASPYFRPKVLLYATTSARAFGAWTSTRKLLGCGSSITLQSAGLKCA
jgi:hypothetical protein